jgi:hypothetical protein
VAKHYGTCPFCGGVTAIIPLVDQYADDISWPDYQAHCANCGYGGPVCPNEDQANLSLLGPGKVEVVEITYPSGRIGHEVKIK